MLSFGDKNDKDEVFKILRRHIAIFHAAFTIIDFVLLTIWYYFQVYGFNSFEQRKLLAFAIPGFLAFQIGYVTHGVTAACTDLWKNQKMDKSWTRVVMNRFEIVCFVKSLKYRIQNQNKK